MVLNKHTLRTSLFFAILFMWMISFGFFGGMLNTNTSERVAGVYLSLNIAAAGVLFLLFPIRLRLNFPGVTVYTILIVWLFIIHLMQEDYVISAKRFFSILLTQSLMIVLSNYAWKINFFKLVDLILYYLAIVLSVAIYIHVTKIGPIRIGTHIEEFRMGGLFTFGQAATLGGLGFLFSFYQLLFNPSKKKIPYILLTCFFVYCLVASDLRTAIGACMVAVCVQYVFFLRGKKKSIFPFLVLMVCLYGGYKLYVSLNSEGAEVERDFEYRQMIWAVSSHGIIKRPLLGYGNSGVYFKNNPEVMNFNEQLVDPHSSSLAFMLQSGVVAFIILLMFLFRVGLFNFQSASFHTKALVCVFVYWIIVGSTGGFMYNLDYEVTAVFFSFTILAFCGHPDHRVENKKAAIERSKLQPVMT